MPNSLYEEYRRISEAFPPLDKPVQEALAAESYTGNENAKRLLFLHNTTRLIYFANRYSSDASAAPSTKGRSLRTYMNRWAKYAPHTLDKDEVVQAAAKGLMHAIKTFDPGRGIFNQHCNVLIWQHIYALRKREETLLSRLEKAEEIAMSRLSIDSLTRESHIDDEKEFAEIVFWWWVDRLMFEDEAQELKDLLENAPSHPSDEDQWLIRRAHRILKKGMPPADYQWLSETLG